MFFDREKAIDRVGKSKISTKLGYTSLLIETMSKFFYVVHQAKHKTLRIDFILTTQGKFISLLLEILPKTGSIAPSRLPYSLRPGPLPILTFILSVKLVKSGVLSCKNDAWRPRNLHSPFKHNFQIEQTRQSFKYPVNR